MSVDAPWRALHGHRPKPRTTKAKPRNFRNGARPPAIPTKLQPIYQKDFARFLCALAIALSAAGIARADWDLRAIDSAVTAAAMTLDASDVAHVCYFTPEASHLTGTTGRMLKYATNAAGPTDWVTQPVVTLTEAGSGCDIAVGTDGVVRIAYVVGDSLMYAHNIGGVWTTETIVASDVRWRCAIALDSSNTPHVMFSRFRERVGYDVYYDGSPFYAVRTDSGWAEKMLQRLAGEAEYLVDSAQWQDIVVNSSDVVYGTWKSAWVMMLMAPLSHDPNEFMSVQPGFQGTANRLELTPTDGLVAAGMDRSIGTISLGLNTTRPADDPRWYWAWRKWNVENCGGGHYDVNAHHLGLAVDATSNMHLAFYDAVDGDLKYHWHSATSVPATDVLTAVVWPRFTELVESDGNVGHSPDLDVDAVGDPHLVCLDLTDETILYGKREAFSGPQLRVAPNRWNYHHAYLWPERETVEIAITNPGTANLLITGVAIEDTTTIGDPPPNPVWEVRLEGTLRPLGALPATIAPGDVRTIYVDFRPDTFEPGNTKTGELAINSNWGSLVIGLRGHGIGGSGRDDACFIATAAYGSPLADEVNVLRRWRDECLMSSPVGREWVKLYYDISPPIARAISRSASIRTLTRWCLQPVIWGVDSYLSEAK